MRYRDARQLVNAIAANSAKESEIGRAFSSPAADLGLSAELRDAMGPREKIRRVAEGAASAEQISQFSQAGAQLNLLKLRRQPEVSRGRHQMLGLLL